MSWINIILDTFYYFYSSFVCLFCFRNYFNTYYPIAVFLSFFSIAFLFPLPSLTFYILYFLQTRYICTSLSLSCNSSSLSLLSVVLSSLLPSSSLRHFPSLVSDAYTHFSTPPVPHSHPWHALGQTLASLPYSLLLFFSLSLPSSFLPLLTELLTL